MRICTICGEESSGYSSDEKFTATHLCIPRQKGEIVRSAAKRFVIRKMGETEFGSPLGQVPFAAIDAIVSLLEEWSIESQRSNR